MKVRPYDKLRDTLHAIKCLNSRDMDLELVLDLPKHGLIALEGNEPIAMGFIRRVEGPYAILDSYITNADVTPELRDRALDTITRKLISLAELNDIKKLMAFSSHSTIIERSVRHGMSKMPYEFTLLSLPRSHQVST